jgi:hypothetical protein
MFINMDINRDEKKERSRMNTVSIFQNIDKKIIFVAVATILLAMVGLASVNLAQARGAASCDGTYLIEYPGTNNLWTFSKDGTVQVTDTQELDINLSHAQGVWQLSGASGIKATWLAFLGNPDTTEIPYGRVDAEITFENGCDTLQGTFDARQYKFEEDPLDPTGGELIADNISFTGRRINP